MSVKCESNTECAKIHSLLKHESVLSKDVNDLGHINLLECVIDVGDAWPIKQPARHLTVLYTDEDLKVQIQGVIKPSPSPRA